MYEINIEWTLEAVVVAMMILMREGRTTLLTGVAVLHPPGTLIGIATGEHLFSNVLITLITYRRL